MTTTTESANLNLGISTADEAMIFLRALGQGVANQGGTYCCYLTYNVIKDRIEIAEGIAPAQIADHVLQFAVFPNEAARDGTDAIHLIPDNGGDVENSLEAHGVYDAIESYMHSKL